jgi:hypothetical protein
MEDILKVIESLSDLVSEVPGKFAQFSEEEINHKPAPEKWSKKEILGHLCDSCFNNIQRVVRVQYEEKPFITYNQDHWVKNQNYQNKPTEEVIDLWKNLHRQFIHILKTFPEDRLESIINVGKEVTAKFVITDYLSHQNHHLRQIFGS